MERELVIPGHAVITQEHRSGEPGKSKQHRGPRTNRQVILDKSNQTDKYSAATFTQNYGFPTFIDDRHSIAHNKVIINDGHTVLTGSFNFMKQAEENNAENL